MDSPLREQLEEKNIDIIGQESFKLEGDYHRLVTFLNQCLKDRNLIFGLSKKDSSLCLRIYEVTSPDAKDTAE